MKKTILLIFTLLGVAISATAQVDYQKALQAYQQSGGNVAAAQAALGTTEVAPTATDLQRTREAEPIITQVAEPATLPAAPDRSNIYGRDIFSGGLSFEPNLNIATPDNYMLGPGDEVLIDVWGDAEVNYTRTISPEGTINIPRVGPITLSGYTVKEANARIKRSLARIYAGINSGSTSVKLTLGNIRSIQVNIVGEVANPGTYTLSSLASLFHALYAAGGVSEIGSLRDVKVLRSGEVVVEGDIYDFLLSGDSTMDISLRDGDMIRVEPLKGSVEIDGNVRRPMRYETKPGETIADLIAMAGGFTSTANRESVFVDRLREGSNHEVFTVKAEDFDTFEVLGNDNITVGGSISDRYDNRVTIEGAVYRGGNYALSNQISTVKELIEAAGGLRDNAFLNRAIIYREKPDWTSEMVTIDLGGLMNGSVVDIALQKNDRVVITTIEGMRQEQTVTIYGAVGEPGTYNYAENMTIEDLLVDAGGLLESASTVNVSISRRIKDSKSTELSKDLLETFTVEIDPDLTVSGGSNFKLQPFDQVYVRRSPVYITQSRVTVNGEVVFAGDYSLSYRGMRLVDAINEAGGITPEAYVKGAYLMRTYTPEEQVKNQAIERIMAQQRMQNIGQIDEEDNRVSDTISIEMLAEAFADTYTVGIDLEKALNDPTSDYNIVLRDGDVITIPLMNSTVQMLGAVNYPNSVSYRKGQTVKDYIKMAGGYAQNARKSKPIVVYMNGMVDTGNSARIEPGCQIIIPYKVKAAPVSVADVASILQSTSYSAAMIMSVINMLK
ncbi:MAG: SLBB domain-containing protein [Tidjanibacter sp.]|nr:SLBB domain-containing protein [Tidjanibacter sp.]